MLTRLKKWWKNYKGVDWAQEYAGTTRQQRELVAREALRQAEADHLLEVIKQKYKKEAASRKLARPIGTVPDDVPHTTHWESGGGSSGGAGASASWSDDSSSRNSCDYSSSSSSDSGSSCGSNSCSSSSD